MHKGLSLLLLLLGLLFSSSSSSAAATVPQRRCFNLTPYEPILNGVIDAIPGRLIQDLLPVPLILADGGEVWSTTINILICKLDLILDQVSVQVLNTNFEKINLEVINKESIFMTIPFGVQMTARFQGDCGLYKPKVVSQIEFAATISANTDVCIDILGISDPANILNYTYATVSDIGYKADAQGFFWCIYDALPLLRSIIDKILEDNIDKIWAAVDKLITEALLPAAEKVLNGVLRAIGIQPYNATANALDEEVFAPMRKIHTKFEDKIRVINTGNFSQLLYNDKGTDAWMDGAYYRPSTVQSGFYPLGDYAQRDYNIPNGIVQMVMDDGGLLVSKPTGYERVWTSKGARGDMDGSFWRPIPPAGFLALGHVAQKGYDQPSVDVVRVVKEECVVRCDPWLTWTDRCSGADGDVSIWTVAETTSPTPGTFISMSNYNRPDDSAVLCLNPDCVELV